jgi:hypothetical protein
VSGAGTARYPARTGIANPAAGPRGHRRRDQESLVTCVLNTIDDTLDRSDPGGTEWGADAVKHLAPLLDASAGLI